MNRKRRQSEIERKDEILTRFKNPFRIVTDKEIKGRRPSYKLSGDVEREFKYLRKLFFLIILHNFNA